MKILLLTDTGDPLAGGAEKHVHSLLGKLKKHDVKFLSFGKRIKETKSLALRHFFRIVPNIRVYRRVRAEIKKFNPDVIHLHNLNKYTPSVLYALRGYPVIQTVHDYGLICPTLLNVHNDLSVCKTGFRFGCLFKHKRGWSWPVYVSQIIAFKLRSFMLKRLVKMLIAPTPPLAEYLKKQGYRNVEVLPFTLDKKYSASFSKMDPNHVLYVGQLERNKGVNILLYAMKEVLLTHPKAHLTIAGMGSYAGKLKAMAGKNVKFTGYVKNVHSLYEKASCVVVPSIIVEQFGFVTAEAMLHSRPVIGSDRGGTAWLVSHGKTGYLFNLGKAELANYIRKVIDDKTLVKKMGKAGEVRIHKLCGKDRMPKLLKYYSQVR
ncbi:MAG: glycosyltransferase family 4 protein [Candidatus Nanoarchaeia archaeon]